MVACRIKEVVASSKDLSFEALINAITNDSAFEEDNLARKKYIGQIIKNLAVDLGPAFIKLG